MTKKRRPRWEKAFLRVIASGWSIKNACEKAGVCKSTVYERRANDPEFAAKFAEAMDDGADLLEDIAYRSIVEGSKRVLKDGQGNIIEQEWTPDTRLLAQRLRAKRPIEYADRSLVDVQHSAVMEYRSVMRQLEDLPPAELVRRAELAPSPALLDVFAKLVEAPSREPAVLDAEIVETAKSAEERGPDVAKPLDGDGK